jgi:hypothetical protein
MRNLSDRQRGGVLKRPSLCRGVEAHGLAPVTPAAVLNVGSDSQLGEGHRCQGPHLGLFHINLGDNEGVGDFVPVHHGPELKRCEHDGGASDEPDRDVLELHVAIVDASRLNDVEPPPTQAVRPLTSCNCWRWHQLGGCHRRGLTTVLLGSPIWNVRPPMIGMASISERENREIEAVNASGNTPVVFIHGLWLLPSGWDSWVQLFSEASYGPLTPDWPDDPETVEDARANPDVLAKKTLKQVADHIIEIINALDKKPAVMGHSTGGLLRRAPAARAECPCCSRRCPTRRS